jgi:6-pyruvoyltetrahydropterin/6-carboxytetrahydropterin synthase
VFSRARLALKLTGGNGERSFIRRSLRILPLKGRNTGSLFPSRQEKSRWAGGCALPPEKPTQEAKLVALRPSNIFFPAPVILPFAMALPTVAAPFMFTCKKTYSDIPFAHRQHCHDGHCALIHGHNWNVTLEFGCREPDENGFVVDFGKLRFLREWMDEHLDHACLFNEDDPLRETIVQAVPGVWKPYIVPRCSSEGIAKHLFTIFGPMVRERFEGRVFIVAVEVTEDSRNSARYSPGSEKLD